MEDPKAYIEERLVRLSKGTSNLSQYTNEKELAAHITRALLSKKFRKWAVDDALREHLPQALKVNFEKEEPIKFVMPFGGYKLWRLEEAPEADWAELFAMMYYAAWLKPIADAYKPGVWFDFSSDDVVIEMLNNVPTSETSAYMESFNKVISFLTNYLPSNIRFTLTPVGSRYTEGEFKTELDQKMKEVVEANGGKLPVPTQEEVAMIDLNSKWPEEVRSQPDWYAKNKVMHDAYMAVSKRRPYNRAEDKILVFTKPLPKGIALGTTKTSIAKFWAGVGALKKREDRYIETVLSPEQIQTARANWAPLSFEGLEGKNFTTIRIVD